MTKQEFQGQKEPGRQAGGKAFSLEDILREFGSGGRSSGRKTPAGEPATPSSPKPEKGRATPKRRKPKVTPDSLAAAGERALPGRRFRLRICGVLSCLGVLFGLLRQWGDVLPQGGGMLLILGELGILTVCALCCMDVLLSGRKRPGGLGPLPRLLMGYILLLALALGVLSLREGTVPELCAPVCLVLTAGMWASTEKCKGMNTAMRLGARAGNALSWEPGYYKNLPGLLGGKHRRDAFVEANGVLPLQQRLMELAGAMLIPASAAGAWLLGARTPVELLQYALLLALGGTPLWGFLLWYRPWELLVRRLGKKNAALYGWPGIKVLGRELVVPLGDGDLFTPEEMRFNGIKFFAGADPDRVVFCGASLMTAAGGELEPMFTQQAALRGFRELASVGAFRRYESGGVSGEIGQTSVLVGTLSFIQSMGVHMPQGTKVSQAIYVALDGDLAGVFAISYGVSPGRGEALEDLAQAQDVLPVVTSGNFMVTEPFLRAKFKVDTEHMLFPNFLQRWTLGRKPQTEDGQLCLLVSGPAPEALAPALCGSRVLMTALRWGTVLSLLAGLAGFTLGAVLLGLGHGAELSAAHLMVYQLLCLLPGVLLGETVRLV